MVREEVKVRLKGRAFLVRYADDCVMGFEYEEDARRVYAVLPKRFTRCRPLRKQKVRELSVTRWKAQLSRYFYLDDKRLRSRI
jgi:RNA-directed DNA polymerase